jgi:aerobic carbon-monoxide dehydrogenase medium subunit
VRLPPFEVHRPTSVAEVLALRSQLGEEAALYAGGTELLLVMKLELADYSHLIDLKRVADLGKLTVDETTVTIGSTVTHLQLESNPEVRRAFPALAAMAAGIGNVRVRNSGTLGGNLAFADPHSDPATFLTATGGLVDLVDASGSRTITVEEFTTGAYTTVLDTAGLLRAVRVPVPGPDATVVHRHVRFRERPAVTVTVLVRKSGGEVLSARVAVGSVCAVPTRIQEVERLVVDRPGGFEELVREAVASAVDPVEDLDGSIRYKRHLAGEIVVRSLREALDGAPGEMQWN